MRMNKDNALRNLIDISEILKKHNTSFWLQDGTLLGLYRDKNFISHDTDTDMGIMFRTFNPKCIDDFEKRGFSIFHTFGYVENSFEIAIRRNHIKTDLFFHYEEVNFQYHCAFTRNRRIDYRYDFFKTKEVEFLNHKFPVPEDELKFIKTKYGENWEIPTKNWDWKYSPKNHVKTNIVIDTKLAKEKYDKWRNN